MVTSSLCFWSRYMYNQKVFTQLHSNILSLLTLAAIRYWSYQVRKGAGAIKSNEYIEVSQVCMRKHVLLFFLKKTIHLTLKHSRSQLLCFSSTVWVATSKQTHNYSHILFQILISVHRSRWQLPVHSKMWQNWCFDRSLGPIGYQDLPS